MPESKAEEKNTKTIQVTYTNYSNDNLGYITTTAKPVTISNIRKNIYTQFLKHGILRITHH